MICLTSYLNVCLFCISNKIIEYQLNHIIIKKYRNCYYYCLLFIKAYIVVSILKYDKHIDLIYFPEFLLAYNYSTLFDSNIGLILGKMVVLQGLFLTCKSSFTNTRDFELIIFRIRYYQSIFDFLLCNLICILSVLTQDSLIMTISLISLLSSIARLYIFHYFHCVTLERKNIVKKGSKVNKIDLCSICLEKDKLCSLECNHYFHSKCIEKWIQRTNSCPVCREHIQCDKFTFINICIEI
jgi:hypothetical protein